MALKHVTILFFLILLPALASAAEKPVTDSLEIGVIEHLDEFVPENIMLINENNEKVELKKLITKPTVLTFVYFECPMLCTPLMNGLADVIDKSNMTIGKDYQVLTIGFNVAEPLSLAVEKKKNYLREMRTRQDAEKGWQFFISDSANIAKATNAFGFRYKYAGNNVFLHSATLIFISPEGKITRYLNGTYFLPFEFKMAIIESSKGISGPTINKVLQFCYGYDSQANRYVLDITKVFGALMIVLVLIFGFFLIVKPMLKKRRIQHATNNQKI